MAVSDVSRRTRLNDINLRRKLGPERFSNKQKADIRLEIELAVSDVPEVGFEHEEDAARFLRGRVQGIAEKYDIEIGFYIVDNLGFFAISSPYTTFQNWTVDNMFVRPGVASFHTHQDSCSFSGLGRDRSIAVKSRANAYLSNKSGLFQLDGRALSIEIGKTGEVPSDWRARFIKQL